MRKLLTQKKGFTLVEMIISLAIFTVVALVAVGALIRVMDANKKSISLKTSINNLNFALEAMTREMRMGKNYACGQSMADITLSFSKVTPRDCDSPPGDWIIVFNSQNRNAANTCNLVYAYKFALAGVGTYKTLYKAEQDKSGDCSVLFTDNDFYQLISPEITINKAITKVDNFAGQTGQPKVFIYLSGTSGIRDRDKTEFSLQTTISQRLPK